MLSRRMFLYGAGALTVGAMASAHEHVAKQLAATNKTLLFFTPVEIRELEAVCAQIIPTDHAPGAREAGAVYFLDYAAGKSEPNLQPVFRDGLKQLAAAAAPEQFSKLSNEEQIAILKKIEKTEFFEKVRTYTILGFLGDPKYGGNRDKRGWAYIGFDYAPMYEPPFGYYDAELLSSQKKEGQ